MTALTIRDVPEETIEQLKIRAVVAKKSLQAYALDVLQRQLWEERAHEDMTRLRTEDLSGEPDAWGYDEGGQPVDLRSRRDSR
ncbi:hypothetical protein AB0M87_25120 [Streptomyces sp. NPDC051320]|uniref:FitA-like ribbon-helix-helix domain-containing protein n=1 Tax=Streptomyces sp. NPDC051320 TaxID=3154644 RepID=UPI0034268A97